MLCCWKIMVKKIIRFRRFNADGFVVGGFFLKDLVQIKVLVNIRKCFFLIVAVIFGCRFI